jgi:hypothetical protein
MLAEAFEAGGGIERVLAEHCVILTSDHGHCDVLDDAKRAVIRLDALLANYRQAELGRSWRPRDQIMICPNMRAAQIYVREPTPALIKQISTDVLSDERVDQVICRTSLTRSDVRGYSVLTARGCVEFAAAGDGRADGCDAFGGRWRWSGDAGALGLEADGRTIEFVDYPNAFERIAGVLDLEQSGELWVTAKPGTEFEVPGGKAHVGGASHAALHALDSLTPVVAAGGPAALKLPRHLRSIDIAPLCMQLLGLPMRYRPGDPRPAGTLTRAR